MTRALVIFFLCAFISACGVHYYKIDGDDVVLVLRRPKAKKVVLFSSRDEFKPFPAADHSGRWVVELPADRAFRYFYRVDGRLYIPDCEMKENDDFGTENCVFDPHL